MQVINSQSLFIVIAGKFGSSKKNIGTIKQMRRFENG